MPEPSPHFSLVALVTIAAAFGCSGGEADATSSPHLEQEVPMDERELRLADTPPLPVMGGTLHVTADDAWLVATDPDRDQIHILDVDQGLQTHVVELPPGAQPWRIAEDSAGRLHVALRGGGAVASLRPEDSHVTMSPSVCAQPRGIAVDDADDVWVACAGGELVTVREGLITGRTDAPVDARDVWFDEGEPWVSTFRAARAHGPDARVGLPNLPRTHLAGFGEDTVHPSVAWRTRAMPGGGFIMVHQLASDRVLSLSDATDLAEPGGGDDIGATSSFGDGDGGGDYGGGGDPDTPCEGIVTTAVTIGDRHGDVITTGPIARAIGAVDVAYDDTHGRIAIVSAAARFDGETRVTVFGLDALREPHADRCQDRQWVQHVDGQVVAAAFDARGRLYVQVRNPAQIFRYDLDADARYRMGLTSVDRTDTGHTLFHELGTAGIACMSCHPEGGDDGRVWAFSPLGLRHTPALDVGLAGTEPLHWQGDLPDFAALVDEVMVGRMGLRRQPPERAAALQRYVYAQHSGPTRIHAPPTVARGAEAFAALGCGSCHSTGAQAPADFGFGFALQSPPLAGVGLHPPYMHDGRAETLRDAVLDMVGRTVPAAVDGAQVDDLVAYLETL